MTTSVLRNVCFFYKIKFFEQLKDSYHTETTAEGKARDTFDAPELSRQNDLVGTGVAARNRHFIWCWIKRGSELAAAMMFMPLQRRRNPLMGVEISAVRFRFQF